MQYRRHPDYWQFDPKGNRLPYIDAIRTFAIADPVGRNTAFRTGKIDLSAAFNNPRDLRSLLRTNPNVLIQEFPSIGGSAIAFRLDTAPWSDVRVRRAMALAIDFDTWAQTVFDVPRAVMSGKVNGSWYGLKDQTIPAVTEICGCPWYQYDPKRAKELLAEAGYKPGDINLHVQYFAYQPDVPYTFELWAAYWKAIGVNTQLTSMDYTVIRPMVDRGSWTDMTNSYLCCPGPSTPDAVVASVLPGTNWAAAHGNVNDPVLTSLAKEYLASYRDEAKRLALLRQIHARWLDQVYDWTWNTAGRYSLFSARLRNYQPTIGLRGSDPPHSLMIAWFDDDWSFAR
jgi:ABC-type transport system substrate-binding protein